MKLKYQTGIATLIQFIAATVLGFTNELYSSISGCVSHGTACVSNTFVSLVLVILTALWYGFVAIIGYTAQDRRSRRLACFLILIELGNAGISLLDAKHFPNILSLITSLIDLALAVWVITLAWRISHAKGGRVMAGSTRKRQRRHTIS